MMPSETSSLPGNGPRRRRTRRTAPPSRRRSTGGRRRGRGCRRRRWARAPPLSSTKYMARSVSVEGLAHGGAGRGHVLEGRGRRQPRGLLQLLHKLPGVESVEEVDVAGLAVQHLNGQVAAVLHEDARRLLVRVAAVLEFQFVHESPIYDVSGSSGGEATRYSDSLRQSSLCGNAHWAFPVAAKLARSEHPVSSLSSAVVESAQLRSLRNSLGERRPASRQAQP